ncbi:hypothetical protein V2G26_005685 [Clonostachys chloroleuca]
MASFNGWVRNDKIIQLQSELVSDDITAYTKARVSEMARWKERSDIQAEIETTLLEKANGMFRWLACQFDTLEQCLDPPSVRRELQNLPKTLDATYAQILQRIHPNHLSTAKRLLQFLTYSERPLKLEEAVDLITVDPSSQPAFSPENRMPIPEEIIQYCSSLVVPVHEGKRAEIQLAHFSVKEYLLSDRLEPHLAEGLDEISAKASIIDVEKGADINAQGGEYVNALQAVSVFGHLEMAEMLIQKGADINARCGEHGNALQAALETGHRKIAEMLIQNSAERMDRL